MPGTITEAQQERACPTCGAGSADARLLAEARIDPARLTAHSFASRKAPELMHHRLVECGRCDTAYASPAPDPEVLAAAYAEAAFDSGEPARFAAATYARHLHRLLPALPRAGGALDVGTGDGAFLAELEAAGVEDVTGVEPSAAPVAAAAPGIRERIRLGVFDAAAFAPGQLRLVTAFQTLEHVPDPLGLCRDAAGLVRPGGAVWVIAHDRRALVNRALGRRSPIYDIEHLQLYSPRSLRALLERAGLERVRVAPIANRYPVRYWARLLPLPAGLRPRVERGLAGRAGSLPVTLPVGNLSAVGFRPA